MAKGNTDAQISAYISSETNQRLDMYVRESGVKKSRVVEDALLAHLDALDELPSDVVIPASITLTNESFDRLVERLNAPPEPTQALRDLMHGRR